MKRPLWLSADQQPVFPPAREIDATPDGLVALGGALDPATLVEAYGKGVFPWEGESPIPWFSPDPRCILVPSDFRASRSLRKFGRSGVLRVTVDGCFRRVMQRCGSIDRRDQQGTWINPEMIDAYTVLHEQGVAHSVEVWQGDELVGGIYGLAIGAAFFGESMFAARRDASKLGLMRLCAFLADSGFHFVDCQQDTAHLISLGAITIRRCCYLDRLDAALECSDRWTAIGGQALE
ncbi:MAG: leucyl/phenylalanyl-tRNA--protein transferase [Kiritimatiellia bacterium]